MTDYTAPAERRGSAESPVEGEMDMSRTTLGTVVGLVLGLALAFGSFGQMLIVGLFAVIGFVVAKVLDGDLDLSPYVSGRRTGR